jgi:hypothetical protein
MIDAVLLTVRRTANVFNLRCLIGYTNVRLWHQMRR